MLHDRSRGHSVPGNAADTDSLEEAIKRLARLSPLEYEPVRMAEAKRLNVRIPILDKIVTGARKENEKHDRAVIFPEIDPWPDPVDGAELLDDLTRYFCRFLSLADRGGYCATCRAH